MGKQWRYSLKEVAEKEISGGGSLGNCGRTVGKQWRDNKIAMGKQWRNSLEKGGKWISGGGALANCGGTITYPLEVVSPLL